MNEFLHRLSWAHTAADGLELDAAKLLVENQIAMFTRLLSGAESNFVWTNMVMPTELFYAFGLIPVHTELLAGWIATLGLSGKYIRKAVEAGFSNQLCSYHKAVIGALEAGTLPAPKLAVFSSHICDGGSMLGRYCRDRHGTKVFLLDVPYDYNRTNKRYLELQLTKLKSFLALYTKSRFSGKRMEKSVRRSNEAKRYLEQANALRAEKTTFQGYLALRNMFGLTFLLGSEVGVRVAKTYYEEILQRAEIPCRKRILWVHFAPLFAHDIMRYFEEQLGCIIAFDITAHVYWDTLDETDWVSTLADKLLSHFYLGDGKRRMDLIVRLIEQYRMDGIVLYMHQGCRAIAGSVWEFKYLSEARKIPFLELHGDCIAPDGVSKEQTKLRLEAFSESLGRVKNVSRN